MRGNAHGMPSFVCVLCLQLTQLSRVLVMLLYQSACVHFVHCRHKIDQSLQGGVCLYLYCQLGCSCVPLLRCRKLVVPVVKRFEGFCTAATQHAVKGFMARQGAGSKAGGRILPNSSSSCSSSRSNASSTEHASSQNKCSIPATPAATAGTGTPKSSEGSSSEHLDSSMWTAGLHDWHPRCILCMEEQSKLQLQSRGVSMPDCGTCPSSTPTCFDIKCPSTHAARDIGVHNCCMDSPCSSSGRSGVCSSQCSSTVSRAPSSSSSDDSDSSGSSSNGSNSSCSSSNGDSSSSSKTSSSDSNGSNSPWPVACDDPFLWRRLLWKLLGKLSPEAQAFYATHADMCPHHEDVG